MSGEQPTRRQIIFDTIDDMVADLMYYRRKEDSELPPGAIEQTIADGEITIDEIVDRFRGGLP